MRTRILNQLQSVAMSEGLQRRGGLRSKPGRERLELLPLEGATGYLLKSMMRKELVTTIRAVHEGKKTIAPEISSEIANLVSEAPLTEREIEVLQHVARGRSNKIIAGILHLSEDTVKGHIRNVLSKLGASDRTHAVVIATRRGYFDIDP